MKQDIYETITNNILESLENGTAPWRCPWDKDIQLEVPTNGFTGRKYNGINFAYLLAMQNDRAYTANRWYTFKQAKECGGQIRKGEKGTKAVFFKTIQKEREEVTVNGEPVIDYIPMAKQYTIFNVDQIEGIEDDHEPANFDSVAEAEALLNASGVPIAHAGAQAYYRPDADTITMPEASRFGNAEDYYATALHELVHSTKQTHRCDRQPYSDNRDTAYAFEELVAELGSVFLMAQIGLSSQVENHDSYIANWASLLKNDRKAFFKASAKAQQAVDWILEQANEKDEAA